MMRCRVGGELRRPDGKRPSVLVKAIQGGKIKADLGTSGEGKTKELCTTLALRLPT